MTESTVVVLACLVFGWSVLSGRLARSDVSGPFLFVVVGLAGAWAGAGFAELDLGTSTVHLVAEVTLALVLFADASRLDVAGLRRDWSTPARLLLVGLPLTILAGWAVGTALFPDLDGALVWLLAAALAPTDAALSASLIADRRVPARLRRDLNVESGLNDGIVTPVVTLCIAVAASEAVGVDPASDIPLALRELGVGVLVGVGVGAVGALVLRAGDARGWMQHGARRLAILALAVLAFTVAGVVDGNAFVAAFVAGLAFAAVPTSTRVDQATQLTELVGELAALVVWFVFGATLVLPALEDLAWQDVAYAAASLTAVRMVPVAVAMVGRFRAWQPTAFLGWFGPRGLASVVFALLAVEQLGEGDAQVELVADVIALTVLASVVLHGVSAQPLAGRFGAWWDARGRDRPAFEHPPAMRQRRPHRHHADAPGSAAAGLAGGRGGGDGDAPAADSPSG